MGKGHALLDGVREDRSEEASLMAKRGRLPVVSVMSIAGIWQPDTKVEGDEGPGTVDGETGEQV